MLITGGAGFIGSHLADALVHRGDSVVALDDLSTFVPYDQAYAAGFEDMPRRVPVLTRLQTTCGFRPRTPLSVIIADVLADQRARAQSGQE